VEGLDSGSSRGRRDPHHALYQVIVASGAHQAPQRFTAYLALIWASAQRAFERRCAPLHQHGKALGVQKMAVFAPYRTITTAVWLYLKANRANDVSAIICHVNDNNNNNKLGSPFTCTLSINGF